MATKAVPHTTKTNQIRNGLLPTPPMPDGLPKANLTDNARQVLMKRYVRRGDDGKPAETVEEMFWRVAYHVAKVEEQWDADIQKRTIEYYHLAETFLFLCHRKPSRLFLHFRLAALLPKWSLVYYTIVLNKDHQQMFVLCLPEL